jgi:hypothetical protein
LIFIILQVSNHQGLKRDHGLRVIHVKKLELNFDGLTFNILWKSVNSNFRNDIPQKKCDTVRGGAHDGIFALFNQNLLTSLALLLPLSQEIERSRNQILNSVGLIRDTFEPLLHACEFVDIKSFIQSFV